MISREVRLRMKREVLDGVPKAVIARRYGVSRQSVYNVLNAAPATEKSVKPSKLDPFKGFVADRLAEFDLPATVLLREIKERGYASGVTILKEFVGEQKSEYVKQVVERFETLPGRQAQLDWGECGTVVENGERKTLYAFVVRAGLLQGDVRALHHQHASAHAAGVPAGGVRAPGGAQGAAGRQHEDRRG